MTDLSGRHNSTPDPFGHPVYTVRRKVLKLLGGAFHIFLPDGTLAFYSELKAFKLKEDIRLFTDEHMGTELLRIHSRQILDVSATYDVYDSLDNNKVGALKRKGLKSLLKDEWIIMDHNDHEIGLIMEDSVLLATVRRFMTNLVPQTYYGDIRGQRVCRFRQHFNPFVMRLTLDFSEDHQQLLDRRLGIAAAVLLCGIEGRQN